MKILHPLQCYFPSQAGGPCNSLYWLNSALNINNFSCEIIATNYGLVDPIDSKTFSSNHTVTFFNLIGKLYLKKCLQELKTAEVVQFSSLFFPPTLPILFVAIWKKKTIILSPRGELYEAAISQKAFKKRVWFFLIKMFQSKMNFHATNDFELEIIQKKFPRAKSTVFIPNYIEMPKKLNLEIKRSFVFVGRINPIKNIHLLISTIAKVYEIYPDIKLYIVGSARLDYEISYERNLEKQIKQLNLEKVVFFKGHLVGEVKNRIIASSKALILPSKSGNFGNVVLEALSQGTPVIASKHTPWKILEEQGAGYWVDTNIQALSGKIVDLLNLEQPLYENMRANSFQLCKSKYNIETNVRIWESYYQRISL